MYFFICNGMNPLTPSEQLIEKCRSGDRKAQRALVKRFSQPLFLHCYRYLKDKSDAEEVLSDGFVKIFQHLSNFEYRDEPSFEGWVRRIIIHEALGFLRKKKKLIYADDKEYEAIADQLSIDGELAAEAIYQLILSLPLKYRIVFNLYAIEGYTHQEIAQLLEITESTSRSQLTRARKMLQERMVKTLIAMKPEEFDEVLKNKLNELSEVPGLDCREDRVWQKVKAKMDGGTIHLAFLLGSLLLVVSVLYLGNRLGNIVPASQISIQSPPLPTKPVNP